MPSDFFQRNTSVFRASFPDHPLSARLQQNTNSLAIIQCTNGEITAEYHDKLLHSKRNPSREASRLASRYSIHQDGWVVLFGFGLGYIAESILQSYPDIRLIIIDPKPEPFFTALNYRDITSILLHPRLTLLIDVSPSHIQNILGEATHSSITLIPHIPTAEIHPEDFYFTQKAISQFEQQRTINHNTLKRFGKRWVRNLIANLPFFPKAYSLELLKNAFTDIPGVLIAAGPTFDDAIEHLHQIQQKCLIVAVDTALPLCLRHNIMPDIVVVVDPQYWNTRHLDSCKNTRSLIVSESSVHPRVFRCLSGPFFFGQSLFPLGRMLDPNNIQRGELGAGGSVATSAFDVLRFCGCTKIFSIGLDLGFPQSRTHCSGSFFEERIHTISTRFLSSETQLWRYIHDGGRIQSLNYNNQAVFSDQRMELYKNWFTSQFQKFPEIQLHPLSRTGNAIPGAIPSNVEDLLDLPDKRTIIDQKIQEFYATKNDQAAQTQDLISSIQSLIHDMKEIDALSLEAISHIKSVWDTPSAWNQEWQDQLKRIDYSIQNHSAKDTVGFLLHQALQEIQNQESHAHPLSGSIKLYSEIHESVLFHVELLKHGIQLIDQLNQE